MLLEYYSTTKIFPASKNVLFWIFRTGARTRGVKSSSSLQLGTSVGALMMEAYRDPARCSYPLHPFLSINVHCAPASVSKLFSYKLEIFSDGYASPKFIPQEIFLTETYAN